MKHKSFSVNCISTADTQKGFNLPEFISRRITQTKKCVNTVPPYIKVDWKEKLVCCEFITFALAQIHLGNLWIKQQHIMGFSGWQLVKEKDYYEF